MHTCVHTYTNIHTRAHTHIQTHTQTYAHTHIYRKLTEEDGLKRVLFWKININIYLTKFLSIMIHSLLFVTSVKYPEDYEETFNGYQPAGYIQLYINHVTVTF